MKKTLVLLTTIILLTGCTPILKTVYGIKNPKLTTTEKTQNHLTKKGIQGKPVYFKSAKDLVTIMKNDVSIPDAVFFNSKGQQVEFRATAKECVNDVTVFLGNINMIDTLPVKKGTTLNQLVQNIADSNGKPVTIDKNADAIVFINWSTYMGKLNTTVFEWTDIIQKIPNSSNVKVDYYLLSFDLLDHWEDKQLLEDKKK